MLEKKKNHNSKTDNKCIMLSFFDIQSIQNKNHVCCSLEVEYSLDKLTMNMNELYTKLMCYFI